MTVDLFMYYTSLIPVVIAENPTPNATDMLIYDDIIKRVVTYTNLIMTQQLASSALQLYQPHDSILSTVYQIMTTQPTYTLENLSNIRFSSASLTDISALITTIPVKTLMDGSSIALYSSSSPSPSAPYKVSRFFYN